MSHGQLSSEQKSIRGSAREYLDRTFTSTERRRLQAEEEHGFSPAQWRDVCELGWVSMLADEDAGGLSLGVAELALLMQEVGYAAAPMMMLPAAVATALICAASSDDVASTAEPLISGALRATVAMSDPSTGAVAVDRRSRLHGSHVRVPYAAGADVILAEVGAGQLMIVDATDSRVVSERQAGLDQTRLWHNVTYDGAPAVALDVDNRHRDLLLTALTVGVAADSVGLARRALEMAVTYAHDRRQFGRQIGTFQGVSHRCAQMLLEVDGAWTLTWAAAQALDDDPTGAAETVAMAKAYASDAGRRVTASALQVHGGIGFTAEHDVHLLLTRGYANAQLWGGAQLQRAIVAERLLGPQVADGEGPLHG